MVDEYIFSGSLPENASTYVKREADDELYQALQQGEFCYVLNSRQSGKSSLRVRIMSRLSSAGVECASIDLSSVSIQNATQDNWYADLIVKLIDSFVLDVDFKDWWEKNQLNSPLMRFSNFLEKYLLAEIEENIVIFIDEIDSILSLNFSTDDFFAFIRSCYNQRVDNLAYNRLTFCLLGVASPCNLIQDKQRTPFNIGKAISLKGFQLHEVEPLSKGLRGKFNDSQAVIKEILDWTKGQPFLTQKLCQFMVEESEKNNPRTVEQVVKSQIIESWESQDEPEHLRTIRARILRDEERARYLLNLYQKVRCSEKQSEITADNTIEQSELLLSGLVARRQDKLRVYNLIYKQVFNDNWVENQLKNLHPYSEAFRAWIASEKKDESRLLRGKALVDANEWAKNKNLSHQDKEFLAASRGKKIQDEIATKEREAQLERERKNKEAAEKRNLIVSEANKKAKQWIRVGIYFSSLVSVAAVVLAIIAFNSFKEAEKKQSLIEDLYSGIHEFLPNKFNNIKNENIDDIRESIKHKFYNELEYFLKTKKWREADEMTNKIMLFIAKRKAGYLYIDDIENFPCNDLKKIDDYWVKNSDGRFGFSVQKQILKNIEKDMGKPIKEEDIESMHNFESRVGWYDKKKNNHITYENIINLVSQNYSQSPRGILPTMARYTIIVRGSSITDSYSFFILSRATACKL